MLQRATSKLIWPLAMVALAFIVLPIFILSLRGVQTRGWEGIPGSGVSESLTLSLFTTSITIILIALFGTPLAYVLARSRFPLRRLLIVLVELPVVMPPAVAGLALLITYGRRGALGAPLNELGIALPFTTAAVIMAQIFVAAPFYIRSGIVGFQHVPREIEAAARVDGAAGFALFRFVTLPLAARPLAAGLTLGWARAMGEFGATILFAGSISGRTQTMPLLVYGVLESNIDAAIWTGVMLIGFALIALIAAQSLQSGEDHLAV